MFSSIVRSGRFLRDSLHRFRREECGAILVEMTLITPLMLTLSAGVFEFGNLIHKKLLIEAGLDDAARYRARCTNGFAVANCDANAAEIAVYGVIGGTTPRVAGWTTASVTIATYDTSNAVDPTTGLQEYRGVGPHVRTVRVTTTFTYAGASLLSYLGFGLISLAGSHEERLVGF